MKITKLNSRQRIAGPKSNGQVPIKLDLSFGELPVGHPFVRPNGFDPCRFPWTHFADASVSEAYSAYLLNRIPGNQRPAFMDELWRVLMPRSRAMFIVPYWNSARSVQDPFSEWPPLCEQSFLYFNKQWREQQKLPYKMKCDFDFSYGYAYDPETQGRPDDTRAFWVKHYCNSAQDLQVVLIKKP